MPKIDEKINALRGERVKKLLKEENRSQKWLAEKLFLKPEHLNMMLNGKRHLGEDKIQAIASLFPNRDIRIGWLLGYERYESNLDLFMGKAQEIHEHGLAAKKLLEFAADLLGYQFEMSGGEADYLVKGNIRIEFTEQEFEELEDELIRYSMFLIEGLNCKKNKPPYSIRFRKEALGIG